MAKVTVYTAEWCPWCHKVMDFLKEKDIEFEAKDVENREYAQESMEKSGQAGIPVTVIDEEVVVGFDVAKLKKLLKLE
jgi:glutaredoxin-like YruB-family protein